MTFGYVSDWTDERIEMLRKLAFDGLSASQIACELGGLSRSAVIGKVHRLGILLSRSNKKPLAPGERAARDIERKRTRRAEAGAKPRKRRQRLGDAMPEGTTREERKARAEAMQDRFACETMPNMTDEQRGRTVTFADLNEGRQRHCKFPLGDPQREDFCFCGDTPAPDQPYCLAHCRIAYTKAA